MSRILDFADGFESNTEPSGVGVATINIQDEGSGVANTPHGTINFVGAGVTATDGGSGVVTVTIPVTAAANDIIVQEEGGNVTNTPHDTLNFIGTGVTATDGGGGVADITIVSQIIVEEENVAVTNTPHTTLNFVGTGITATDAGSGQVDITLVSQIIVQDETINVTNTPHTILNFTGSGITATDGGGGTVNIATIDQINVQDEGIAVTATPHTILNFVGAGVVATNAGGGVTTITIAGGTGLPNENTTFAGGIKGADANLTVVASMGRTESTFGIEVFRAGEVYAMSLVTEDARTAGTMDVEVALNGVTQNGAGETVRLDATNTQHHAELLSSPVAYVANDRLVIQTTTVGFNPNTNVTVAIWLRDT